MVDASWLCRSWPAGTKSASKKLPLSTTTGLETAAKGMGAEGAERRVKATLCAQCQSLGGRKLTTIAEGEGRVSRAKGAGLGDSVLPWGVSCLKVGRIGRGTVSDAVWLCRVWRRSGGGTIATAVVVRGEAHQAA